MMLNNRVYDTLKFVALVLLPAAAAGYFSLAQVWDLPNSEQVVGTITVVDTFLGLLLKSSTSSFNNNGGNTDGDLIVQEVDGEKFLALGVNKSTLGLMSSGQETVTLRVVDQTRTPTIRVENKPAPVPERNDGPVGGHYS